MNAAQHGAAGASSLPGVAKARLPIPGATWEEVLVLEQRQTDERVKRPKRISREEHPVDEALAEGPTALVVLLAKPPPGLQAPAEELAEFYDCAVLSVRRTDVLDDTEQIQLITGHGFKTIEDVRHFASTRSLTLMARGCALVGFVRLTLGFYVLLVTSKQKTAVIGPHVVFDIRSSQLVYLGEPRKSGESLPGDEQKYATLFNQFDLTTGYYYSHTLDMTRRLATNMTIVGLPQRDHYRWNTFLCLPLQHIPDASHLPVCLIRGSVMQTQVSFDLKRVSIVLIARCSKQFAGARYLKRGVNDDGHVANHVEVEQIVADEDSMSPDRRTGAFSSFVQVRGSVPVYWSHQNTLKPKPPMTFDRIDNSYAATKKHFSSLIADFGGPVFILNLLKQHERKPRELQLSERYRVALQALRQDLSSEQAERLFRYVEFDFRNQTHQVWNELTAIAEDVVDITGCFVCTAQQVVRMQTGVLRSNCVDCVDRTNYGQFFIGLHAFAVQLAALQVIPDPSAVAHVLGLRAKLLDLYLDLGDHIGRQYGGSNTVSAGLFGRGVGWDKIMGIKRFYINQFEDSERQRATNLFLGLYTPLVLPYSVCCPHTRGPCTHPSRYSIPLKSWANAQPTGLAALAFKVKSVLQRSGGQPNDGIRRIDIWDVDSDYYLHVIHNDLPLVPKYDPASASSMRRQRRRVPSTARSAPGQPNEDEDSSPPHAAGSEERSEEIDQATRAPNAGATLGSPDLQANACAADPVSVISFAPTSPPHEGGDAGVGSITDFGKGATTNLASSTTDPTSTPLMAMPPPASAAGGRPTPAPGCTVQRPRSSIGLHPARVVTPFAAHPDSVPHVSPPVSRAATNASFATPRAKPSSPPDAVPIPLLPSGPHRDPVSDARSCEMRHALWSDAALASRQSTLAMMVQHPSTPAELQLQHCHRSRFEFYSSPVLLSGIPVYVCTDYNYGQFCEEHEEARALTESKPYLCTQAVNEALPPEVIPKEDLQPEDSYCLAKTPHLYLADYLSSPYFATEVLLLDKSNSAVTVEPSSEADQVTCGLGLVHLHPQTSGWSLDDLEHALRGFREPDRECGSYADKLVRDLRVQLLRAVPPDKAAERFFTVMSKLLQIPPGDRVAFEAVAAQMVANNPSALGSASPRTRSKETSAARAADLVAWISCRAAHERRFLQKFALAAFHCPVKSDFKIYERYLNSAHDVARAVFDVPKPNLPVISHFSRQAITTADELDVTVRRWLDALICTETGVPRRSVVRYATDLEKQCPRAFVFHAVFTGDALVRWLIDNAERLGIALCDSTLTERKGERRSNVQTFASNLLSGGLLHPVSYSAALNQTVGIVTEPLRFRQSIEPHGIYRFLCQEPVYHFSEYRGGGVPGIDLTSPDSIVVTSYTICRIALQWLNDSATSQSLTNPRAVCSGLLHFIAHCNLTALTPKMRACFFINLFNTLFCFILAHFRDKDPIPVCIDYEIAMHTMRLRIAGMDFSLADIKHGILRNNAPEPRCVLRPFAANDTRLQFAFAQPDPRWMVMLIDVADDHEIEVLASASLGSVNPKTAPADTSSDEEEAPPQPHPPDGGETQTSGTVTPVSGHAAKGVSAANRAAGPADLVAGSSGKNQTNPAPPAANDLAMNSSTADPVTVMNAAQSWHKVRAKFWNRKDEADIEVLRCLPLTLDEFDMRLANTTRQVVSMLSSAYAPPSASNAGVSEAHKAYASKVMSTLRAFSELGATRDAVITTLRNTTSSPY